MDEARRFLRYVMPGYVYIVETGLLLLIVFPCWTVQGIETLAENDSVGTALGSILVAGVVGYIFATVHHWCHWHLCIDKEILKHTPLIERLIGTQILKEPKIDETGALEKEKKALEISWAYWYQLRGQAISFDGVRKIDSLGDQAHALGTTRIASFFAVVTTLVFCFAIGTYHIDGESVIRFVGMLLLGVILILLFHRGYERVGKLGQAIYDRTFEDAIRMQGSYKVASVTRVEHVHNP